MESPPVPSDDFNLASIFPSRVGCESFFGLEDIVDVRKIDDRIRLKGRLHVCSENMYVDPEDTRYPVMKFPYSQITVCHGAPTEPFGYILFKCSRQVLLPYQSPYVTIPLEGTGTEFLLVISAVPYTRPLSMISVLIASARESNVPKRHISMHATPKKDATPATGRNSISSFFTKQLKSPKQPVVEEAPLDQTEDVPLVMSYQTQKRSVLRDQRGKVKFDFNALTDFTTHNHMGDVRRLYLEQVRQHYQRDKSEWPVAAKEAVETICENLSDEDGSIVVYALAPQLPIEGRLLITEHQLVFQPQSCVCHVSLAPGFQRGVTVDIPLKKIARVEPRKRDGFDCALEVIPRYEEDYLQPCVCGCLPPVDIELMSSPSLLLVFPCQAIRDIVYGKILALRTFSPVPKSSIHEMMQQWLNGKVSTFSYLLWINREAGRSLADLSQYPVFPWVIQDYTNATQEIPQRDLTKPVGALTKARLDKYKQRYRDMQIFHEEDPRNTDAPFLYGSFYSNPGYVVQFLFRSDPSLMLRLQSGKFDHEERMFTDLQKAYVSALNGQTDVRELLPHFFDCDDLLHSDNTWLSGETRHLSAVTQPTWSVAQLQSELEQLEEIVHTSGFSCTCGCHQGSKQLQTCLENKNNQYMLGLNKVDIFLLMNRIQLEGKARQQVAHWIDLVFGYKQRGEEAVLADNVFHTRCYADFSQGRFFHERRLFGDKIISDEDVGASQVHMREFGCVPAQQLRVPHPSKIAEYEELTVKQGLVGNTPKNVPQQHDYLGLTQEGFNEQFESTKNTDVMTELFIETTTSNSTDNSTVLSTVAEEHSNDPNNLKNDEPKDLLAMLYANNPSEAGDQNTTTGDNVDHVDITTPSVYNTNGNNLNANTPNDETTNNNDNLNEMYESVINSPQSSAYVHNHENNKNIVPVVFPWYAQTLRPCVRRRVTCSDGLILRGHDHGVYVLSHKTFYTYDNSQNLLCHFPLKFTHLNSTCLDYQSRTTAVVGSEEGSIAVYDTNKGELLHCISAHDTVVAALSVHGNQVVSVGWDGAFKIHTLSSSGFKETANYDGLNAMEAICTTDDVLFYALTQDGDIAVVDTRTKHAGDTMGISMDLLSPQVGMAIHDTTIVVANATTLYIIDTMTREITTTMTIPTFTGGLQVHTNTPEQIYIVAGTIHGAIVTNLTDILHTHPTTHKVISLDTNVYAKKHFLQQSQNNVLYLLTADPNNPIITLKLPL